MAVHVACGNEAQPLIPVHGWSLLVELGWVTDTPGFGLKKKKNFLRYFYTFKHLSQTNKEKWQVANEVAKIMNDCETNDQTSITATNLPKTGLNSCY